jgi:NAD(P)-dependent dehydrogenase (short-subunit alcohol dehydrogenase family)
MDESDVKFPSMFALDGRRALVTGSSRGIGLAIASGLAEAGARVAFHGVSRTPALEALAEKAGNGALPFGGDLGEADTVQRLADEVKSSFGGIDILVLNASIEIRERWDEITDDAFAKQVSVNLDSTRRLLSAFVPGMVANGWGRVLAMGSVQEIKEHPLMMVYAGLKAAQTSMMRNLARQVAKAGVTCNTLSPGAIATDRNEAVLADPEYRERIRAGIPMGEIGEAKDCVGAAIFLCSDAARYITGVRLLADGGMHL